MKTDMSRTKKNSTLFGQAGVRQGRASMPSELLQVKNLRNDYAIHTEMHQRPDRLGAYLSNMVNMSNFSADPKQVARNQSGGTLFLSDGRDDATRASNLAVANESAIQVKAVRSGHKRD